MALPTTACQTVVRAGVRDLMSGTERIPVWIGSSVTIEGYNFTAHAFPWPHPSINSTTSRRLGSRSSTPTLCLASCPLPSPPFTPRLFCPLTSRPPPFPNASPRPRPTPEYLTTHHPHCDTPEPNRYACIQPQEQPSRLPSTPFPELDRHQIPTGGSNDPKAAECGYRARVLSWTSLWP